MNSTQITKELRNINSNIVHGTTSSNVVVTDINTSGSQTNNLQVQSNDSNLATESTLSSINTAIAGTLDVQSNSANLATETTLSSINTAVSGVLQTQSNSANLATEATLSNVNTALSGTLQVQSNNNDLATESTLSSINTAISGTLDVQSNSANLATESTLSSVNSSLNGTLNTSDSTTQTNTSNINTTLGTANGNLTTINSSIQSLYTDPFGARLKASLSSTYGDIKFWRCCGVKSSLSSGSTDYIMDFTNGFNWVHDSDNRTLQIASTDTDDTSGGSGTRTVYIEYFNSGNNSFYSETVTMSGQTAVTLSNTGSYVTFMRVASRGSGNNQPQGVISCSSDSFSSGTPTDSQAEILSGEGFCTSYPVAYVPSTATNGYMLNLSAQSSSECLIYIRARVMTANCNSIMKKIYCNGSINVDFTSDNVIPPDTLVYLQVNNISSGTLNYATAELNGCYI